MYHPNQSPSARRAGEEFLRRMTQNDVRNQSPCCGASRSESSDCCKIPSQSGYIASKNHQMPALAMVYAPVQEWTNLMESPESALAHGTLFQELFLPFEGSGSRRCPKNMGRC